ncbi:MAG: hypothetical protein QM715_13915 [Nibricoccus sp.]
MKTKLRLVVLAVSFALFGFGGVRADVSLSVSADIRIGKVPPPPPPVIEVIDAPQPKGPPPWAPAHGFHRNHTYYFYPACDVYYRPDDHMWFFLEGGAWTATVRLPDRLEIDFSRSVPLTMETDKPYVHHEAIVAHYPKDYFRKVKIKSEGRPDNERVEKEHKKDLEKHHEPERKTQKAGPDDDDDHGKGRGKGKGKNK